MFYRVSTLLPPERKVCQQVTNLHQKQTLRLVQSSIAVVYLMKAMLGQATAIAVVIG